MKIKILKGFILAAVLLSAVLFTSCAKPTHQVYFKITGVSNNTDIYTAILSTGTLFATVISSTDTTATTLPWTSDTTTVSQGQVASIDVTIYDSAPSTSVTVQIYSDGSVVKSATCAGYYGSTSLTYSF